MTNPPNEAEPRVIRVFVSSTFRDMLEEREELVKRVFPQLRKLCESRGVIWGEVDLRWGVTDQQKAEGQVLPICLAEIQNCRYFIGILGERYGWIPDEIPPDLMASECWLREHRERSVTELEILHGVLKDPAMSEHAFFYFRDPAYISTLPKQQQEFFQENPTREEVERWGLEEAERLAKLRRHKLATLKSRIRASGFPVHDNYPNPRAFGEMLLADLSVLIDRLFPEGSQPTPRERENTEHDYFAASRARVYIPRQDYFETLDAHACNKGTPIVVTGEPGSGKSALLGNWIARYRAKHSTHFLLAHFVGATSASTSLEAMLRRIMVELKAHFVLAAEVPSTPGSVQAEFPKWLHLAASQGPFILVLDALNQLEDREGALDLTWLPEELPANVRLIVSTLPGRSLDELKRRGWPELNVNSLDHEERGQLIKDYLSQYAKTLSAEQIDRLSNASATGNPLYLRALLEELRLWGDHFTLDAQIDHYLSAPTVADLYERILIRYERDYEFDRRWLVRNAMSLLWAARDGLSESELLDLLGENSSPLPHRIWSPLYLAAEQSLIVRSGLLNFSHQYFREAVQQRYLRTSRDRESAHLRIATYFSSRETSERRLAELPWQYASAEAWVPLYELLREPDFFTSLYRKNALDVRRYWAAIEASSPLRIVDGYEDVLFSPSGKEHAWHVGELLNDMGHPREALELYRKLFAEFSNTKNPGEIVALNNIAALSVAQGDLDFAEEVYRAIEPLWRDLNARDALAKNLANQAGVARMRGDLPATQSLLEESESLFRETGDATGLGQVLGSRAILLLDANQLEEAEEFLHEAERLLRQAGDSDGLIDVLGTRAQICRRRELQLEALGLLKEGAQLSRQLGRRISLAKCLSDRGQILHELGSTAEALLLLQEAESIFEELGDITGLGETLARLSVIHEAKHDWEAAWPLLKKQEDICRQLGNLEALARVLNRQILFLNKQPGKSGVEDLLALLRETEQIYRHVGNSEGLAQSLGGQALTLRMKGDVSLALELLKEKEQICRQLGNEEMLQATLKQQAETISMLSKPVEASAESGSTSNADTKEASRLGNEGLAHSAAGQFELALRSHEQEEEIWRRLERKDGLHRCLTNQGVVLKQRGELVRALEKHREAEKICRELSDLDGLQRSIGNQANILQLQGDHGSALELHREEERLCRELGLRADLQSCLNNKGTAQFTLGDAKSALVSWSEAEEICREIGDRDGLQRCLGNLAVFFAAIDDKQTAAACLRMKGQICRELGNASEEARCRMLQRTLLGPSDLATPGLTMSEQDDLIRFHDTRALAFMTAGDNKACVESLSRKARLCREAGKLDLLENTLGQQGKLLLSIGDMTRAIQVLEEKERVAKERAASA